MYPFSFSRHQGMHLFDGTCPWVSRVTSDVEDEQGYIWLVVQHALVDVARSPGCRRSLVYGNTLGVHDHSLAWADRNYLGVKRATFKFCSACRRGAFGHTLSLGELCNLGPVTGLGYATQWASASWCLYLPVARYACRRRPAASGRILPAAWFGVLASVA